MLFIIYAMQFDVSLMIYYVNIFINIHYYYIVNIFIYILQKFYITFYIYSVSF